MFEALVATVEAFEAIVDTADEDIFFELFAEL